MTTHSTTTHADTARDDNPRADAAQEDTVGSTPQVFRIVIRATPQEIWDAITLPEFTTRYFHAAAISINADHYVSLGPDGSPWGDSAVLEFDPPRRLVHGWRSLYDPVMAAEPESRVTWEIEPVDDGTCTLTVVHDHLGGAPRTASSISGFGWVGVISGLKSLLETGHPMRG